MRRSSESAIALVMTLVMLSVITVVAVAFLALTQRERMAVAQSTQQSDAEIMAEIAAERGKAEIYARFLAGGTNLNAIDLLVSRNYIRINGFIVNDPVQPVNTTNVNYDFRNPDGVLNTGDEGPLTYDEMLQNLANLYFDPRVPVFVNTNPPGQPEALDFRFWLDLNRNRRFETNGTYPIIDDNGRALKDWMDFIGDPEWIGVLEHPLFPHSRTNRFIGRYCYIILGKTLDANFSHNQGKNFTPASGSDIRYFRNQGFGSWELNLAAFLADLNTNEWNRLADPYQYDTNLTAQSQGAAFRNALEIYNARLSTYQNLAPANQVLNPAGAIDFGNDFIDAYADGLLDNNGLDNDDPSRSWPGSYNWTNFFTPHDFFDIVRPRDPNNPLDSFRARLFNAGLQNSSYDRYTFYRMLAQLSMDSASELPRADIAQLQRKIGANAPGDFVAEPVGKINLNYNNLDYPVTDMVPWDTNRFFNAVADVLLRAQFPFGVSNILVTNYNVTVHRLLQVAANIYDSIHQAGNAFPSIFRPFLTNDTLNRPMIAGYYYDDSADSGNLSAWIPRSQGMPMIVGAKKGLPNFNEYAAETVIMAARKLEMRRENTNSPPYQTNEMFIIGITNTFGLEAWNSYTNRYTNTLEARIANNITLSITNTEGLRMVTNVLFSITTNYTSWPGFYDPKTASHPANALSFKVPLLGGATPLYNGIYRFGSPPWIEPVGDTNAYVENSGFRTPSWHLTISNSLLFLLVSTNRIVDFVHFPFLTNTVDLSREFFDTTVTLANPSAVALCWKTNRPDASILTPTDGVQQQIDISLTDGLASLTEWKQFANVGDDKDAIKSFRDFVFYPPGNTNVLLRQQVPFTPTRKMVIQQKWEVNDPLVHHMEEHLKDETNHYSRILIRPFLAQPLPLTNTLGSLNYRYSPWAGNPAQGMRAEDHNMGLKDPEIWKSDDWQFPTNRFPSIGWLGRIHRGTPWQTIYLKSGMASLADWKKFSLDPLSHPTNDWRLLDVFSVAIHPNASHGQLSVNQTNFAAWSALFGGVTVLSNATSLEDLVAGISRFDPWVIEPGSPQLIRLYEGVQKRREQLPDKTFRRLGDLLSVEELTDKSPFANNTGLPVDRPGPDNYWEWLVQQILSLVKVGDPRYVIIAYGQSLRPAENSILMSGPFMGMCTNYQITGEFVTRTVFQIEGAAGQPRPVVKTFNILSAE